LKPKTILKAGEEKNNSSQGSHRAQILQHNHKNSIPIDYRGHLTASTVVECLGADTVAVDMWPESYSSIAQSAEDFTRQFIILNKAEESLQEKLAFLEKPLVTKNNKKLQHYAEHA
jgi:hypothetical protein